MIESLVYRVRDVLSGAVFLLASAAPLGAILPIAWAEESSHRLHSGEAAPEHAPQRLRLVTYNVLLFQGYPARQSSKHLQDDAQRIEYFARVFESLGADVFALQEAPDAKLIRGVAEKMRFHAARTNEGGYGGGALLSRFPILEFASYKDRSDSIGQVFTRHFWRALLDLGSGKQVMAYGVHLVPIREIAGELRRLREIDMLLTIMRENERDGVPQVLMGDFNSSLGESMYRPILNAGLRDAWVIKPDGGKYTANAVHQYVRIDRIFIRTAWSDNLVAAGPVHSRDTSPTTEPALFLCSDHLPVRAEILLNRDEDIVIETGQRQDLKLEIGKRTYTLRWLPGGTFAMGHDSGPIPYQPRRQVTLTRGFWLLEHEVPVALWNAVMSPDDAPPSGDADLPVVNVSYDDCQLFLSKLNEMLPGHRFALPTEAQWEYAARAGKPDIPDVVLLGEPDHNQPPGHRPERRPVTQAVANDWKIHGLLSNVREWCRDAYDADALTFLPNRDPLHHDEQADEFSLRGSCFLHNHGGGIVSRVGASRDLRDAITGFRFIAQPKDAGCHSY